MQRGKHDAVLMTVPPSAGKSVILAQFVAMMLAGRPDAIDNVVIVFPNEVLYKQDRKFYEKMQATLGSRVTTRLVFTKSELEHCVIGKTLVIIDEADHWWMDLRWGLDDAKYIVGVSATSHNNPEATEAVFLKDLKVKIIDSKIVTRTAARHVYEVPSIRDFFRRKGFIGKPGFLVYCE